MEICVDIFCQHILIARYLRKDVLIDQCNVTLKGRLEKLKYFPDY